MFCSKHTFLENQYNLGTYFLHGIYLSGACACPNLKGGGGGGGGGGAPRIGATWTIQ